MIVKKSKEKGGDGYENPPSCCEGEGVQIVKTTSRGTGAKRKSGRKV